jgi:hypothetical protein
MVASCAPSKMAAKDQGAVMPQWDETFSPEEIWELVAYLKFLSRQTI